MFPIRPVPDNDVKKPQMFVFKDMDDYENRGENVDVEYTKMMAVAKKKSAKKPVFATQIVLKPEPKPQIEIPKDIVGKQVKHKVFGLGEITAIEGTSITVRFEKVGLKKMGYEFCMERSCWNSYKEDMETIRVFATIREYNNINGKTCKPPRKN